MEDLKRSQERAGGSYHIIEEQLLSAVAHVNAVF
jgi:hypothetical protein